MSVGKKSEQTVVQMRTDVPVWEQGFTFLVPNPDNDTLQVRIIDQKTEKELGHFIYILSTLLEQKNMEVVSQPFQLQKSGPDSKITMSLCMRILKKSPNTEDDAISQQSSSDKTALDALSRGSSVRVNSEKLPNLSTLEKQESRVSTNSFVSDSDFGAISEDHLIPASGTQLSASPPNSTNSSDSGMHLVHRTPSITSSAGSAGLGRIQLTTRYSVQRQRLVVIVHKIM